MQTFCLVENNIWRCLGEGPGMATGSFKGLLAFKDCAFLGSLNAARNWIETEAIKTDGNVWHLCDCFTKKPLHSLPHVKGSVQTTIFIEGTRCIPEGAGEPGRHWTVSQQSLSLLICKSEVMKLRGGPSMVALRLKSSL